MWCRCPGGLALPPADWAAFPAVPGRDWRSRCRKSQPVPRILGTAISPDGPLARRSEAKPRLPLLLRAGFHYVSRVRALTAPGSVLVAGHPSHRFFLLAHSERVRSRLSRDVVQVGSASAPGVVLSHPGRTNYGGVRGLGESAYPFSYPPGSPLVEIPTVSGLLPTQSVRLLRAHRADEIPP